MASKASPQQSRSLYHDAWLRLKKNKAAMVGLFFVLILVFTAIFAGVIAPHDPYAQNLDYRLKPPTAEHPLGTDDYGRDILSRIIYGARVSLMVGIISEGIALTIGVVLGALAGYYGGRVDNIIMRLCDIMFAFPELLFCIGIMFALGPGIYNVFIAIGFVGWAGYARLVRGQILSLKKMEFVEAAHASGAKDSRIILKHILPNTLAPIIVMLTLSIPGAIMSEASLSFLGLGAQPPMASWGSMIYDGRSYLRTFPWFSIAPGIAIMLTVLGFNLFGDGLRDALDPRLKR
ncbi:MAG: peptide/nickel transport system permease protein [Tepidanaerobacteraceae bacterium]|nr:peptide/nickel transport system permease protein [Tepidanaerobacteraceae bacterium]